MLYTLVLKVKLSLSAYSARNKILTSSSCNIVYISLEAIFIPSVMTITLDIKRTICLLVKHIGFYMVKKCTNQ